MNSKSLLISSVSLLSLLSMMICAQPSLAYAHGGAPPIMPRAAAPRMAAPMRSPAPMRAFAPQVRSVPTGGGQQWRAGVPRNMQHSYGPARSAFPGPYTPSGAQRDRGPGLPERGPYRGTPLQGQYPGARAPLGRLPGTIPGERIPPGGVGLKGGPARLPGRVPGAPFPSGQERGHERLGAAVAYPSLAHDGHYQSRGFVDPGHHIGNYGGHPWFERGNHSQFAESHFNRLGDDFYRRNWRHRYADEDRWPWRPSPFLGLALGVGFYSSWGYDGIEVPYDTGYFALDDYCATPYMFFVQSGRFYRPGAGYINELPAAYAAPITIVVTEVVPDYDEFGNITGYESHTFYYDAFADQYGNYGYYDYLGDFHAVQW